MPTPTLLAPTLLATALLAATATTQRSQPPTQEQLVQKRTEKLAKPVFEHAAWLTDYDQARAQAKKDGKLLLTYFTRSYAG